MKRRRQRLRPGVEDLDTRFLMATTPTSAPTTIPAGFAHLVPGSYPSANRFRPFTPSDLQAYAQAYLSFRGETHYNADYDFNGTGFIGQNDATPILRGLQEVTPKERIFVNVQLLHGEQLLTAHPSISGAATHLPVVTVIGKTVPNSIIFYDSFANSRLGASGNYKFEGGALVADGQGNFSYTLSLTPLSKNSLATLNLLIRDPYNDQTIRAFPILRVG